MSLASKLNRRITILKPSDDVDEVNQPLYGHKPVAKVWAAILPLYGRELFASQQANSEVTTRIVIRYREDIDRSMIAKYGNKEFEFLYFIEPEMGKKEIQIMCKERQ